jgi:hypothetical protein
MFFSPCRCSVRHLFCVMKGGEFDPNGRAGSMFSESLPVASVRRIARAVRRK